MVLLSILDGASPYDAEDMTRDEIARTLDESLLGSMVGQDAAELFEWLGASWALTQGEETLAVAPFAMILR